uniref:G_PROTEIN_RECEP_F1_2 domain-containing protein n=1 Tax=Steinernema glaseri TaxID=37863 RepID=A0A1I8ADL8_9BILA
MQDCVNQRSFRRFPLLMLVRNRPESTPLFSLSHWLEMSDVLKLIESILWTFAVVGLCYVTKCLRKASLLHYNLKMILINLSIALIGYGCCRIAMNTDSIAHYYGIGQQYLTYRASMLVAKIIFVASLLLAASCCVFLPIERTVATFVPKRYEQMKRTGKGVALFVILWTVSFGVSIALNFFWQMWNTPNNDNDLLDSSFLVGMNTEFLLVILYGGTIAYGANGILVCFLYKHNKKQRSQLDPSNLNVRYQYSENIATIRLLLAFTGTSYVVALLATILISFYYVVRTNGLMGNNDLLLVEQSFHVLVSMYAIFYNIIFLAMHRPNRDQLVRDVRRLACFERQGTVDSLRLQVKSIEGHCLSFKDEGNVYFSYLSQQWNVKA